MKLVVDANVLFALSNPASVANNIFAKHQLNLLAPDFALIELYKYKDVIVEKSGIDFDGVIESLKGKVTFVDKGEYKDLIRKALSLIPDPKDASYLALSLRLNCSIWSNDPHLRKQSEVSVFTTEELIKLLS